MKMLLGVMLLMMGLVGPLEAETPLQVVASQEIFGQIVKLIGQESVEVNVVTPRGENVHFISPKPSDVGRLSRADLYVHAGLDLEAWSTPLVQASGNVKVFAGMPGNLDMSANVYIINEHHDDETLTRANGDIHLFGNPHYHMSPANMRLMAETVYERLSELKPANQGAYHHRLNDFLVELDERIAQWQAMARSIQGVEIISYHDDIAYLVDFLGLKVGQFIEPKPGIPPTPRHLQRLEQYINDRGIRVLVTAVYYPKSKVSQLAEKLGLKVIVLAHGVNELPQTDTIIDFYDYNIRQIIQALR
jgi:zinc/manganese transport system substrate-binding protein